MDNLTHSMAGAVLGQMGLKRRSGLGMPTVIIAANIPDLDAACVLLGTPSLAMRRGLTHGPIALLLLPILLTAIMVAFDRWQARRGTRPADRLPVSFAALWPVAMIGTLSHPAMDWLNSYGIRLLSPFTERWFYGDTLFIIDIWLWLLLIGGYVWARRGEGIAVARMNRHATIIFSVACAYIFANGLITGLAEAQGRDAYRRAYDAAPEMVVANPQPLAFWRRELLWRGGGRHGSAPFDLFSAGKGIGGLPDAAPTGMDDPAVARARAVDADARAFLFWSRMPLAARDTRGDLILTDQRFRQAITRGSFNVVVPAERLR